MIKHLKIFFYPPTLIYTYNQPKEQVLAKIKEVLSRKVAFFSERDMKGSFIKDDTFAIELISFAYTNGVKYSSTLVGQVIESQDGTTLIKTKAKPSFALYFIFFLTTIPGIAYLYKSIQPGSLDFLLWALAMLIVGPIISIGISNVSNASIRERYRMYIHKELIGINTTTNRDIGSGRHM